MPLAVLPHSIRAQLLLGLDPFSLLKTLPIPPDGRLQEPGDW